MSSIFKPLSEEDRENLGYVVSENELREYILKTLRPKGKWIVSKEDSNFNCSICGCNPRKNFRASSLEWIREINGCDMRYCPWCGAEMESNKHDE